MSSFKKLDDLPKGEPHSYEDVMKAMAELHKLVLKQSEAYGGKNSKYIPAQVLEGSLFQEISTLEQQVNEDADRVGSLMDIAQSKAEELAGHLKGSKDTKALSLLGQTLKFIGLALSQNKK